MIRRLVRLRARLWWAEERARASRTERVLVYLFLAGCVVFAVWSGMVVFRVAHTFHPELARGALVLAFMFIGFARTVISLPRVIEKGFLATDLDVWLSAPIPPRALYALKCVEVGAAGIIAGLAAFTGAYGYARAVGLPGDVLFALASALVLVVLSGLAGQVLALAVIRAVPPRLVRLMIVLLPWVVSLGIVVGMQVWFGAFVYDPTPGASAVGWVVDMAHASWWLPTTWAANLVAEPAAGRWSLAGASLALVASAAAVLFAVGSALFVWVFVGTWQALREASSTPRTGTRLERLMSPLPPRVAAMVAKDWRTLRREVKVALGLFAPILFVGIMLLSPVFRQGFGSLFWVLWLSAVLGGFVQQAFLVEKRNFTLLRTAPVSPLEIFVAKLIAFGAPAVALGMILAVVIGRGQPAGRTLLLVGLGAWAVAWACLFNLCVATLLADFRRDTQRPDPIAGLTGLIGSAALVAVHGGTWLWTAGWLSGSLSRPLGHPAVGLVLLFGAAAASWGTVELSRRAVVRLERLSAP